MNPNKNSYKEYFSHHIRVKLLKTKYKEKILKVLQKKDNTFKSVKIRISDDFLTEKVEDKSK
ncbi:hypothetical protein HZY93_08140 [Streptococcus danieliae]|uniref:Uncharacterized protein n=1 Tax=Streptococcus danieliae TaxID=747656 RepID=A0A7Z0LEI9_9STRE|nr:hypothetical protein [Streptococcus danieliae]NYS49892.1 hypothetical protein [Streptococcus danieliae]